MNIPNSARKIYIRLLKERVDFANSLPQKQRDVALYAELINEGFLDGTVGTNGDGVPINISAFAPKVKGRLFLQQLESEEARDLFIAKHREEFKSFDRRKLAGMDDKSLATWQSEYDEAEPEWRLAEHEWQRRITAEQIRGAIDLARNTALINFVIAISAAITGVIFTLLVQAFSPTR